MSHSLKSYRIYDLVGLLTMFIVLLSGCALSPAQRFDQQALTYGLHKQQLRGSEFQHIVYSRKTMAQGRSTASTTKRYHIYLEGDGTPWLQRTRVARDPTPRRSLMLELMVLDNSPPETRLLYLGRPCYHGLAEQTSCHADLWTFARYSERVVASMAAALNTWLERHETSKRIELVFIGHSGGATLAMLLAERFPQTRAVLTFAGNLDPDAWTALHNYTPLYGSLNPSEQTVLADDIIQHHYGAEDDINIPAKMIHKALQKQTSRQFEFFTVSGDHVCCWPIHWQSMLNTLGLAIDTGQSGLAAP